MGSWRDRLPAPIRLASPYRSRHLAPMSVGRHRLAQVSTGVAVTRDGYVYHVGQRPETIRGIGYNPPVAGWTRDQRRERLERDLSLMAAAGVNTVIGWNPAAFDGLTLDVAYEVGIGVALPFDVDFTLNMGDSAVREAFVTAVLTWVDQYKAHPALRIWAVGNEVLQRSVPPSWCSAPPTDGQAAWSSAWSGVLIDLADAIHARDPMHPVLYREADDAYTPWLAHALRERPGERRWLIYGMNVYNPRLRAILGRWQGRGVPTSLMVSEFAPLGAPFGQRADRLREIWSVVRSFPAFVLGGAAYVWSTDGPEAVDRQFGLVDERGIPVDDGLETLSQMYATTAQNPRAHMIGSVAN